MGAGMRRESRAALSLLILRCCLSAGAGRGREPRPEFTHGVPVVPYWLGPDHSLRVIRAGTQVSYPDRGTVSLSLRETELFLELERNDQLYSAGYLERHYQQDGTPVTMTPNDTEHCVYQGRVRGYQGSWLALSLCSGLSGVVVLDTNNSYYLQPITDSGNQHHILYRTDHLPIRTGTCGQQVNSQSKISITEGFSSSTSQGAS
ncbi:disintegrin and metalloproteinase domain-containing protein 33-like [Mustelus asterias]